MTDTGKKGVYGAYTRGIVVELRPVNISQLILQVFGFSLKEGRVKPPKAQ